jgi:hypothetical protein
MTTSTPPSTSPSPRYTPDDLVREAARQHARLTDAPDRDAVGEQMEGEPIPSAAGLAWHDLSDHEYDEAEEAIHDLLHTAASISPWAIGLGRDGLKPLGEAATLADSTGRPVLRLHLAVRPGIEIPDPDGLARRLAAVLTDALEPAAGPASARTTSR